MNSKPLPWDILHSEKIFDETQIFHIYRQHCRQPQSALEGHFYVLDCPNSVQVIARTDDGQLILVEQFRFGSREISLETPAGLMEKGETPIGAALRELEEETGFAGETPQILAALRPNPAIQNNQLYVVFVDRCRKIGPCHPDPLEELSVKQLPIADVLATIQCGAITNGLVVAALLLALPFLASKNAAVARE